MIDYECANTIKIPSNQYKRIEKKVVDLYIEQGINHFPIDPFVIIRKRGYELIPFSKVDKKKCLEVRNSDNDAFSFYSPDLKTYIIVYNDLKPLQRIRFTLMHELGHIDLGHKGESELAKKMADYYAAYALAPSPLIGKFASDEVEKIVSAFWISTECADICRIRYQNWKQYGGRNLKGYEIKLINLFK